VAAHVVYSYSGADVPDELHQLVDQGKVGGVILFGDNVNDNTPQAMQDLQSTWSSSASYNGVPLLITTDQEGGQVKRLPGGPTQSEKEVGLSSDPSSAATEAGQEAAATLLNYHNNANLAPVCGVFREPGDFLDQYERSFSNKSSTAADCVSAFVTAQQAAGALTAAKHFPGLGAATTDQDTDAAPVTLNQSFDDLLNIDMPPFQAAVKAGTKMIMPSWAYYPALDADYPSGLSSKWIQDELRGRLGFQGVTISDAIEAGGLNHFGKDDGYRATLASAAGMDIILAAARDPSQGSGIVDTLSKALSNGTLDSSKFDDATQRILDMRKGLPT
jgi:beta-glucosidase-like glycosyl hydrolase